MEISIKTSKTIFSELGGGGTEMDMGSQETPNDTDKQT